MPDIRAKFRHSMLSQERALVLGEVQPPAEPLRRTSVSPPHDSATSNIEDMLLRECEESDAEVEMRD